MVERIRRAGAVCWALCGIVAVVVVIGIVGWALRVIWPPLILAGAIVFLLNPVVTRLQHRHLPRAVGTGLSYLGVAAGVTLVVFLVAPLATRQYNDLAEEWPELRQDLERSIDDLSDRSVEDNWPIQVPTFEELEDQFSGDQQVDTDGDGRISAGERQDRFAEQLGTARELLLKVVHVGIIFVLAPIIAFYLLVDLPHIRESARALVPERARGDVMVVSRRLSHAIGGYFRGQLAVAIVVGTMASIGMLIVDLPFWLIVGMIAGLFNMVPLIGPWIGAVPGIAIAVTTGGGLSQAIAVAVVMAIVQQIDNHFISPIVMQRAVKLHPAVVMLALLAGGTLGGFFGLLLAVPATAVLKILIGHAWRHFVLGQPLDEIEAAWDAEDALPAAGIVEDIHGRADHPLDDDPDDPPPAVGARPAAPEPGGA